MAELPPTLVVFGAQGQVGRSLCALTPPSGWRLAAYDRASADITDAAQVQAALDGAGGRGVVVNLAAYTQVDQAESNPDAAFAINRDGAGIVARAAAQRGLALLHLSTDYVFPGTQAGPVAEDAPTAPLGVYGASKLAGEDAVAQAGGRALILRTSWVFGPFGNNFVKAILRRMRQHPELRVVADQTGCPTPAPAIAATAWALAPRLVDSHAAEDFGIFHYCGDEATTWFGFAQAIVAEAAALGWPAVPVHPIATSDYPVPARRPAMSVLDCGKLARRFGIVPPSWRQALRDDLPRIMEGL